MLLKFDNGKGVSAIQKVGGTFLPGFSVEYPLSMQKVNNPLPDGAIPKELNMILVAASALWRQN